MRDEETVVSKSTRACMLRSLPGVLVFPAFAFAALAALAGSAAAQGGGAVEITGDLKKPQVTAYMYGTHAITDESTGALYALRSEKVDLKRYAGERVTVSGSVVPGYEEGALEGGPALLEVSDVETGDLGSDEEQYSGEAPETRDDSAGRPGADAGESEPPPILPDTGGIGIVAVLLAVGVVVGYLLLRRR